MNQHPPRIFDPLNDDKSILRLQQVDATDLMVVNAAKVSFGAKTETLDERGVKLISDLLNNRHGTPFEHNLFTFHVRCPIFIAREWQRHRIGSFNEYSGRYKEMKPDFYVPAVVDFRTQVGTPMNYSFETMEESTAELSQATMQETVRICWEAYQKMLTAGVAKEVARMILPLNIYTEFYWTVNARSLMHFLGLRNSEHAQLEIRVFAEAVEILFGLAMPVTHAAFLNNDRVGP